MSHRAPPAGALPGPEAPSLRDHDRPRVLAQRQDESEHKDKPGYRSEFRYGSFCREVPLPTGVDKSQVAAS